MTAPGFTCPCCGVTHPGLPAFARSMPPEIAALPEDERRLRAKCSSDLAGMRFPEPERPPLHWLRCVAIAPLPDAQGAIPDGPAGQIHFGLWLQVERADFRRYVDLWDEDVTGLGCRGLLSTDFPGWAAEGIAQIPCTAHWANGTRPMLHIDPHPHPMARELREGVPPARAGAILHHFTGPPASQGRASHDSPAHDSPAAGDLQ